MSGLKLKDYVYLGYQEDRLPKKLEIPLEVAIQTAAELEAKDARIKELEHILTDIINGYYEAPGEMWIPDYVGEYIDKARAVLEKS